MTIAVVGAGFYGCHIALSLKRLGLDVELLEAESEILTRASGNNQFRLHQGFHYPRNFRTRIQSLEGFHAFKAHYPGLSSRVKNNVYAIPRRQSLTDFKTYRVIMAGSGLDFADVDPSDFGLIDCEGAVNTPEEVLNIGAAREYFRRQIGSSLQVGVRVEIDNLLAASDYSMIIDCTWGHEAKLDEVFFEPCMLLYYEDTVGRYDDLAITLVDGDLCSLYPTETSRLMTLSSVPFTPLGKFESAEAARAVLRGVTVDDVQERRTLFEEQMAAFLPGFDDGLEFVGPQLSIKTKVEGASADRSCQVFRRDRLVTVLSGKVDTVFYALSAVVEILAASSEI